jgi:hypothetical protein
MRKVVLAAQALSVALIVTGLALVSTAVAFIGAGLALGALAWLHDPDRRSP